MSSSWKPSLAIQLSLATHAAAAIGALASPGNWPWALGALAINQSILIGAGLLPRTTLLGPNLNRLPATAIERREVALTIDDGPHPEVTPRVLDLLDAAGAKASFFCIGRHARQHPVVCREIVARGHRVENHGDSHSWAFSVFGWKRIRADISDAQATLADITGQAPGFFRPTAGLRNPLLDPLLVSLDLKLASWTRRAFDTREGDPRRIHARLTNDLGPGDILLLHDRHGASTADGVPVILAALPQVLDSIEQARLIPVTLKAALQ